MFDQLPLADVLCVYGAPRGTAEAALKQWIQATQGKRHVLVLDPQAAEYQQGPFTHCHPNDVAHLGALLKQWAFLHIEYWEPPPTKSTEAMEAFTEVAALFDQLQLHLADLQDRGIPLLQNVLENEAILTRAKRGKGLFGQYEKIPAIICGAGPSLDGALPSLRSLKKNALLFAAGSALKVLDSQGIIPDFGGIIDPHPPTSRSLQTINVPLFFQSRTHPQTLKAATGPLLWLGGGFHDFFDREFFDGGWNAATFLVAVAYHLGCDPIILAGVDLAQKDDHAYAGGLEREEQGRLFAVQEGLYTRKDWWMAAEWLKTFANNHPTRTYINCSAGLPIEGFEKKEMETLQLFAPSPLKNNPLTFLQSGANVYSAHEIRESRNRVEQICNAMIQQLEQSFPHSPKNKGSYILLEVELEQELFYQQMLRPLWSDYKPLIERQSPPGLPQECGAILNLILFIKGVCDGARAL